MASSSRNPDKSLDGEWFTGSRQVERVENGSWWVRIPNEAPMKLFVLSNKTPVGTFYMLGLGEEPEQLCIKASGFAHPEIQRSRLPLPLKEAPLVPVGEHPYIKLFNDYLDGSVNALAGISYSQFGTSLSLAVWSTIQDVPFGSVTTYKLLAQKVKTNAYRVVGSICGKNKLSVLVPCHRVIRKPGNIGGYHGSLGIKRYLLEQVERVNWSTDSVMYEA